jgi:hypothetical protein
LQRKEYEFMTKGMRTMVIKMRHISAGAAWLLAVLFTAALAACTQAAGADIPTASESQETTPTDTPSAPTTAVENQETAPADANPSPTPVDEADAALVYAQCIRENGYPEWPDPNADGQFMMRRDQGMSMNDPRRIAAMEACQDLRPSGNYGAGPGGMGQDLDQEAMLAFAQCMRDNGVPDFPDPNSNVGGGVVIGGETGIDPNDPGFQAAVQTCNAILRGETD